MGDDDRRLALDEDSRKPEHASIAFLYQVFDDMIAHLGEDERELSRTRKYYEDRRGRVFEDEELWDMWSQAFLEWYALERHNPREAPPGAGYLRQIVQSSGGADPDPREVSAVRAWLTSHVSLFEVRALREGRVELLDVLGGGWFAVAEQRSMAGVSVGDVAELRLVGFEGEVRFGRTFLFHPSGTREPILMHARRIRERGGSRRDIMDFCATLRIRCVRYRHVSARRVYETASDANTTGPMKAISDGSDRSDRSDPSDRSGGSGHAHDSSDASHEGDPDPR